MTEQLVVNESDMSNTGNMLYGWYSYKQAGVTDTYVYRDTNGVEVRLTNLTSTQDHSTLWDDIRFIAMVREGNFVKKIINPNKTTSDIDNRRKTIY